MVKIKTKKIIFRCDDPLYKFIHGFAQANGSSVSEHCRNVMIYFHMGFLMGEFGQSLPLMKKKFLKKFESKRSRNKFVKGYKPEKYKELLEPF